MSKGGEAANVRTMPSDSRKPELAVLKQTSPPCTLSFIPTDYLCSAGKCAERGCVYK